jgi:NADH dehydrogenase FAD-containing subunit
LTAAINLPRNYSVDVIDRQTHFEFLPNIHELLSRVKTPENLQIDRRRLIERAGHRFVIDRVTSIDFLKKRIYTSGRKRINYDICVLAIGGLTTLSASAGQRNSACLLNPLNTVETSPTLRKPFPPQAWRESGDRGRRIGRGGGFG